MYTRKAIRIGIWAVAFVLAVAVSLPAFAQDEAQADDGDKAPLKLKLPEPYYGATPLNYFGPNLERTYKKRPPFLAPKGAENVAKGKPVTGSVKKPSFGKFEQITDDDKKYEEGSIVEIDAGLQYIQIDLGAVYNIYAVLIWHFHSEERVYFDTQVYFSNDPEFKKENVKVVFNNDHDNSSGLGKGKDKEYVENYEGKLVDTKGAPARYVRLYSKGNTTDDFNHYIEVAVYGLPADGAEAAPAEAAEGE